MPPRAARKKNAIPAAVPVAGGSRLEQLPAEVIQSIFDFLYNPNSYHQRDLIRPLSKHLLPFSTTALYRKITIIEGGSKNDLGDLCVSISENSALGQMIQELSFEQVEESETNTIYESHYIRMVENLLLSLKNLKTLDVDSWHMVGKVVLSSRFGREGGKALESIKMWNCFGSIEGSLTEAWSHLRHLPFLSSVVYDNRDQSIRVEAAIPPNLGGFEKVTKLECYLHDFSSSHATNLASLFPTLQDVELVHYNEAIRPNYSPFLDSLSPDSITSIELNQSADITFINTDQFPVHQSLTRFPRLQDLHFCDARIFDSEQIEAIHELNLTYLYILPDSHLSYDLMHQILSGIKRNSSWKKVRLDIAMGDGASGTKSQDGAKAAVDDAGNLVPGEGWKRPDWSIITLPEARELERISIERAVVLDGDIRWGLQVERKFEEEEKWLDYVMKVMRTGPVQSDCTDCGKKN